MACVPEEKPKLEIIENRGEEAGISKEQRAYEFLVAASRRKHPSALPCLAEVEDIQEGADELGTTVKELDSWYGIWYNPV